VLSTLNKLSKGSAALNDAYDEALQRIDGQLPGDRSLARRTLSWISYAQRLLTTKELCHALAVEPGDKALNTDNIYEVEDIISVCTGLVTVDEESSIIRLVHYTTQEYFERVRLKWNPGAQEEITVACLTYLSFDTFRSGSCANGEALRRRVAENLFFDYSAHYWSEHLRQVQSICSGLALDFICDNTLVDSATQAALMPNYKGSVNRRALPNQTSGLHLTARYGLLCLTKQLLEGEHGSSSIGADSKDSHGRMPLSYAAQKGHETVVKLLLQTGKVDVDSKDEDGRTPLSYAVEGGHEAVVRLLLDSGADVKRRLRYVDWVKGTGQTVLMLAVENGHEAVVVVLLDRGADVNAEQVVYQKTRSFGPTLSDRDDEEHRWTVLTMAIEKGHEAVVRLLLDRGADVNAKRRKWRYRYFDNYRDYGYNCGYGSLEPYIESHDYRECDEYFEWTALMLAVESGHEAVVKLLVERDDVEADSKDKNGRTPLSHAAERGHEAVVKLLVERDDVEADSKSKNGRTPLSYAAEGGHEAVVKLLVERDDVEADSKDNDSRTPLSLAAEWGHKSIVKVLQSSVATSPTKN